MNRYSFIFLLAVTVIMPLAAHASVESSLMAVQDRLVGTILPLAAVLGFVFAGFSYITGSPSARTHLVLAIIGAVVGFGASSIVNLIQSLIH